MQGTSSFCTVVEADHPALAGHFPGRPVVPGVILLDLVARALRVAKGANAAIGGIRTAKFRSPVLPGENLVIELTAQDEADITFRILRGYTLVADGTLRVRT